MSGDPYTKHSSAGSKKANVLGALKDHLSPEAVATIIAYLQPVRTKNPDVDREVAWFAGRLVDLVGGDEAFNRLCEELGL